MNDVAEIHNLKKRITYLESLLTAHNIPFDVSDVSQHQGVAAPAVITPNHARFFYALFHGRSDVYAKRAVMKNGKAGYFPVCENLWRYGVCPKADRQKVKCASCPNRQWAPLNQRILMAHLTGEKSDGSDVIGIYPLLPDDTCRFLVFDFDDHEASPGTAWREDVDALRKICSRNAVPCHVERSRSGSGAHIWLFFDAPISAELARKFGSALLTEGAKSVNLKDFKTYDRMLPAQEHLPDGGLGNLIALPLQGQALRQGNVEQYAGRLHRDYEGKQDVIVYDYVDAHIRVLESMYYKRLRTYKHIGYEILAAPNEEKQTANAIFDSESYLPVYEKDLMQARKSIYIASPGLNQNKVRRLIALVEERQTAGVIVTVITLPAESYPQTRAEPTKALQTALTVAGIYVVPQPDLHTHFAAIDQEVVWYGSTNLLSRDKEDDSLMRICSRDVALELLEEISR